MDEILQEILELLQTEQVDDTLLDLIEQFLESELAPTQAPIPQGADLLWILAGANPQAFTQYTRNFPDPAINALGRDPVQLQSVINRLQQQVTLPAGEVEGGVPKSELTSSNVYGYRYDPRSQRLRVRFNSGSVYQYDGVPAQVFKIFQQGAIPAKTNGQNQFGRWWRGKQPSLGAAFYELIRQGGYPYRRLR